MPKQMTDGSNVITVPDVLVKRYEARGWEPAAAAKPRDDFQRMTKAQLARYAAAHGFDVSAAKTKADMQAAILAGFRADPGDPREHGQK